MKSYEELLAERDALATQVVAMRISIISNCYDDPSTSGQRLMDLANRTPQQCLAEIKAEAVEEFWFAGAGRMTTDEAKEYAAKIRNTGTWLKDSNVNGGKRQGGEK